MPIADWAPADQAAWRAATRGGDLLDDPAPLSALAPTTLYNYQQSYGRWLSFLASQNEPRPGERVETRLTPEKLAAYIEHLRQRKLAPLSIFYSIVALEQVVRALEPERDWRWLRPLVRRLGRTARPIRLKRARLLPSSELFASGRELLAQAESSIDRSPRQRAVLHRNGLMMALLAARPLRRANFVAIEIGRHLRQVGAGWTLAFEAHETKTRTVTEVPFPQDLASDLVRYLEVSRPVLLGAGSSQRLWLSVTGRPLSGMTLYTIVCGITRRCFGHEITPHLFRDCLATDIAIHDPDRVRMAATLLGHRSLGHDRTALQSGAPA